MNSGTGSRPEEDGYAYTRSLGKPDTPTSPACLSAKRSARYLDVSVSYFRARIAREVPSVDFATPGSRKRLPRWSITDLDRWVALRRAA